MTKKNITVLGNGSWSSALVKLLTENGHHVHWWMRSHEAIEKIKSTGQNPHYLKTVSFELSKLSFYDNIEQAIDASDMILIGIPSAFITDVLSNLPKDIFKNKIIISAIKGILPKQADLLNEFLYKNFNFPLDKYACITGPCHAEEVAAEKLSYLTFASHDEMLAKDIASHFESDVLRTIVSTDINGVQYASVLKNIYALGAGIAHGLDYGDNFLSVYITNCFSELQQFMDVISTQTLHHYNTSAYLGDLLVTSYSLHSRNRTFGNFIGKGYSVAAAKLELNMVAEGYYAADGIERICKKLNHNLPIAHAIYEILWEGKNPKTEFKLIEKIFS